MSAEEIDLLGRMLRSQAYRELAAIELLRSARPGLSVKQHARVDVQMAEEQRHLDATLKVWSEATGHPIDLLVRQTWERLRTRTLPTVTTDLDLAMVQFVFDRAGYFQLCEYRSSCFPPHRKLVAGILAEEAQHQDRGADDVVALARKNPDRAQSCFERWLTVSLLSFGRPDSVRSRRAVQLGLKARAPHETMWDFLTALVPTMRAAALRFPTPETLAVELPQDLVWPAIE